MIHPFFIAAPEGGLFACLHQVEHARMPMGVVICPPLFGELIQHHRALFRLANRLAETGIPSLRFDWQGTGDSAGDLDQATTAAWVAGVTAAIGQLKERTGVRRVALIGARLGAILAAHAVAASPEVEALVLWEPVDGAAFLDDLASQHDRHLARLINRPFDPHADAHDVLGFRIPGKLWRAIRELRLAQAELTPDLDLLVVTAEDAHDRIRHSLDPRLTRLRFHGANYPHGWQEPEDGIYDVLIPVEAIETMAAWIARSAK